jgi:hypothetical protein
MYHKWLPATPLIVLLALALSAGLASAGTDGDWSLTGNQGTNPPTHFLGTIDNTPLVVKTNNRERLRIDTAGNVGIGTTNPRAPVHVVRVGNAWIAAQSRTAPGSIMQLGAVTSNGITEAQLQYQGMFRLVEGLGAPLGSGGTTRLQVSPGGNVGIGTINPTARLEVNGTFKASNKQFTIDHPLDPANMYLNHAAVESPDMMTIHNGNVTTDVNGNATVTLPTYFEALNRDFRYQLTVVGQFAQAIVASKIKDNRFTIKTDKPHVEVSWQVTGIRQDAYANAHRTMVEEAKPATERGFYLHPLEHGQPLSKGVAAQQAAQPTDPEQEPSGTYLWSVHHPVRSR